MELNMTHENICINETVYDGPLEQSVELDTLLPDYCPPIFKVLCCNMKAAVNSCRVSGDKVLIDATAHIRVLYVAEEGGGVHSLEQKVPFSKTIDLKGDLNDPVVKLSVKTDYINCRVVNQRRLDIRGAVTIRAKVVSQRCEDVICDANGGGLQMKKRMVNAGCSVKSCMKQFTVEEELELSYGKPSIAETLNASCSAMVTDYKIIANKVIIKGEILLHMLYLPDGEDKKPEVMEHSVPISQIVDLEGVDEDYLCAIKLQVGAVDIQGGGEQESDGKTFRAEFAVNAFCEAYKSKEIPVIADVYSTQFEAKTQCRNMRSEKLLVPLSEQCMCKEELELPQESGGIYDIWCDAGSVSFRDEGGTAVLEGAVTANLLALDSDNMPVLIQKELPFTYKMDLKDAPPDLTADATAEVVSAAYSLSGADTVEVRAEVKICGCIYEITETCMMTDITLDEEHPKSKADLPALTLYFADKGEFVWDIAKRYNTSISAIMEENGLDGDELMERGMILIPIVD